MEKQIKNLNEMIESCYIYNGVEKNSFNYNRYIAPFIDELGEDLFEQIYDNKLSELKSNYIIRPSIYKDSDGLSYNELIRIKF